MKKIKKGNPTTENYNSMFGFIIGRVILRIIQCNNSQVERIAVICVVVFIFKLCNNTPLLICQ